MIPPKDNEKSRFSRRAFHCRVAAAAGAFGAAGMPGLCSAETADTSRKAVAGKYIDAHVHLGQPWSSREPLTADVLLRWMDEHQVAQAVVLPLISPEAWYYPISTDWVLRETRPHRDRLIPFCDIDPRTSYVRKFEDILGVLKRYVDAGAKGLGEHKCGGPIDSPENLDIFHATSELKLPVLFHMDTIRCTDRPGLPGLEKALVEAPSSNFIGHAPGWWASISGAVTTQEDMAGYPKEPVAPGGAIDRLMDEYPNLYGDFSAGSGANAICRDMSFGGKFILRRADRLLFGTDYLTPDQTIQQFELFDQLDLPEAVQAKLFRDNARRLLSMPA